MDEDGLEWKWGGEQGVFLHDLEWEQGDEEGSDQGS